MSGSENKIENEISACDVLNKLLATPPKSLEAFFIESAGHRAAISLEVLFRAHVACNKGYVATSGITFEPPSSSNKNSKQI